MESIRDIKPSIGNYNIYGHIVHKKARGCSHFYKLLSAHDKNYSWDAPCIGMERDLVDFEPDYDFEQEIFFQQHLKNNEPYIFQQN